MQDLQQKVATKMENRTAQSLTRGTVTAQPWQCKVTLLPWYFTHTWIQAFHKTRTPKTTLRAVCQSSKECLGHTSFQKLLWSEKSPFPTASAAPSYRPCRLFVQLLSKGHRGSLQGAGAHEQHCQAWVSQAQEAPRTPPPVPCPAAPFPLAKTHFSSQGKQVRVHYKVPTATVLAKSSFWKPC